MGRQGTGFRKKLIEVALPLDAISKASAREKSIRHGHPSTLHLWWARRPLAAARAVLWASLVDDPSAHPDRFPTEEEQKLERKRLFTILERLVVWENSNDPQTLRDAKAEIDKAIPTGRERERERERARFGCWIRSAGAGRSLSRRSGWGWKRTEAISTR